MKISAFVVLLHVDSLLLIMVKSILHQSDFTPGNLKTLLLADGNDRELLHARAAEIKAHYVGNKVYFRGLIELTNQCGKNCYYCGIRAGNKTLERYMVAENEVLEAAKYAYDHNFASLVIQSGESSNRKFVQQVTHLLEEIKKLSNGTLGITLSMGEQSKETYQQWFDAGAHRYLLRIETSNRELYYKIHPKNKKHDYDKRLECIKLLREVGYNVGTGVMIGLPFQTIDDLVNDLMFFKTWDIDMIGMGPYIEHEDTPLYAYRDVLKPLQERFDLSLNMVAVLRILMKDINIAATTAMQTIDPQGREKALKVGANIIMPNLTPIKYREGYLLYKDKPGLTEQSEEITRKLEVQISLAGCQIGYGEWGDSKHFEARQDK